MLSIGRLRAALFGALAFVALMAGSATAAGGGLQSGPSGVFPVGQLRPNSDSVAVEQWSRAYVAPEAIIRTSSGSRPLFYLSLEAEASKAQDAVHVIGVTRTSQGGWISYGDQAAFCAIRKDAEQPDAKSNWVNVLARWHVPLTGELC